MVLGPLCTAALPRAGGSACTQRRRKSAELLFAGSWSLREGWLFARLGTPKLGVCSAKARRQAPGWAIRNSCAAAHGSSRRSTLKSDSTMLAIATILPSAAALSRTQVTVPCAQQHLSRSVRANKQHTGLWRAELFVLSCIVTTIVLWWIRSNSPVLYFACHCFTICHARGASQAGLCGIHGNGRVVALAAGCQEPTPRDASPYFNALLFLQYVLEPHYMSAQ